jgi:hypothetical protein
MAHARTLLTPVNGGRFTRRLQGGKSWLVQVISMEPATLSTTW